MRLEWRPDSTELEVAEGQAESPQEWNRGGTGSSRGAEEWDRLWCREHPTGEGQDPRGVSAENAEKAPDVVFVTLGLTLLLVALSALASRRLQRPEHREDAYRLAPDASGKECGEKHQENPAREHGRYRRDGQMMCAGGPSEGENGIRDRTQ